MLWVMFEYFMASLKRRNFAVFPTADKSKFKVVAGPVHTCTANWGVSRQTELTGNY